MLAVCALLCCSCTVVTAIQRADMFPYGTSNGDSVLGEGDDETSKVLSLPRPFYFFQSPFSQLYVSTTLHLHAGNWMHRVSEVSASHFSGDICSCWIMRAVELCWCFHCAQWSDSFRVEWKKSGHWQERTLGLLSCTDFFPPRRTTNYSCYVCVRFRQTALLIFQSKLFSARG